MDTILSEIKQLLGISKDDDVFDSEITMHINSVITILTQLGVGPTDGFIIDDTTTFAEFVGQRKDLQIIFQEFKVVWDMACCLLLVLLLPCIV